MSDWSTMTTRERLLSIVDGERYPRMRTFRDQMSASDGTVRRHLDALVREGALERHRRARGETYWCRPAGGGR